MDTETWSWEKSLLTSLHLGDTGSGACPLASKCLKRSSRLRWTRHLKAKARPSRGLNDHVKMEVPSLVWDVNIVSPISSFVLNTLIKCFFPLVTETIKQLNSSPGTGPQCYEFECLKDDYSARRDCDGRKWC